MNLNPAVSIVIPVYNGSNYMREAIDSALAQSYENVEVIVVNDGSTDGGKTEKIALSYGDKIRYFHKENAGVASALNLGIKEMIGEWFAWLSHDDIFSPERIEEDINIINADPEVRVTFCKLTRIDGDGKVLEEVVYPIKKVTNPREALMLNGVSMCCLTIHRSCFDKTGLFNESNLITQDVEMSLELSRYFTYNLNEKAVTYAREHPERGTNVLKGQRSEILFGLAKIIKEKFTLIDFFPGIESADNMEVANAWRWLGDTYCSLGAYAFADDCYKKAYSINKKLFSIIGIKYIFGAKNIDNGFFRVLGRCRRVCGGD